MPTEGQFILVIDPSPETAARVNSKLRNAGHSVQVLHADEFNEAGRLCREFRPTLVVYTPESADAVPLAEAARLSRGQQAFFAVMTGGEQAAALTRDLLREGCQLIDADDDGSLTAVVGRLLSLRTAAAEPDDLDELRGQLSLVLDSTRDPIAYFHEGLHVAANAAYLEAMGVDHFAELEGVSLLEILSCDDRDLKQLVRDFGHDRFPDAPLEGRLHSRDDRTMEVRLQFDPIRLDNEDCVQMLATVSAAPAAEAAESTEPELTPVPVEPTVTTDAAPVTPPPAVAAERDPLTGFLFRADFIATVDQGIGDPDGQQRGAVLYLEPDGIDSCFDDLTVAEMDAYVSALAEQIRAELGPDELACRFADAAFAVFAMRASRAEVEHLAERLRDAIRRLPASMELRGLPRACCVGFALLDPFSQDAETVLAHAREAWRGARDEGDAVRRYRPPRGSLPTEDQEAAWVQRIRYALDNEDFFTVQQAVMSLEGDNEALYENVTLLHEDDVDVGALDYQPTAERNGLASRIDRYAIPGLLRAVTAGQDRHIVPISGNSLQDFSFPSWFRRQLQESGTPGNRVFLQLDGNAARDHTKAARRLIEELDSTGCGFTLSNMDDNARKLGLIAALNPALVRIGSELTDDLGENPERVEQIRRVVNEANMHSCTVYVGNVQSSSELALLWQCGVKMVSGDFLEGKHRVIGE